MGYEILEGNSTKEPDVIGSQRHVVLWYTLATIGLILVMIILHKFCMVLCCNDELPDSSKNTLRLKQTGYVSRSKSLAVIVKIPSLADSSVVYPTEPSVEGRIQGPEKDDSNSKSMKNSVLKGKIASKSLKLSECASSDAKGKTSF